MIVVWLWASIRSHIGFIAVSFFFVVDIELLQEPVFVLWIGQMFGHCHGRCQCGVSGSNETEFNASRAIRVSVVVSRSQELRRV